MPGPMLTATRGDEKRTFAGDDAELLRAAVEKGWAIDGHTVVQRDGDYRAVPAGRDDLLEAATAKGWAPAGAPAQASPFEGWVAPPAMAPTDGSSFGEAALAASAPVLEQRTDQAAQQKFLRELGAQKAEEARQAQLQQEHGAGLTSARGLGNAAATAGEGISRGVSLGFDAPAAYIQAGAEQLAESIGGPANPDVPRDFGASLQGAREGIAGRHEANPLLAAGTELVGAVAPALASGGESLAARVLAKTPAGVAARKAAQLGLGAAGRVALEAPGLKGALLRVAAPALKLGVEGAVQGAAQGAGSAANQLWMDNDTHSVAEYLAAATEGGSSGAALGAALGAGLGAALGGKALSAGPEAYEQFARGQGLLRMPAASTAEAAGATGMNYPEPAKPGLAQRVAGKVVKLTPEQAGKARDAAYRPIRDKLNELFSLSSRFDNQLDLQAKKVFVAKAAPGPAPVRFDDVIDELGLSKLELEQLSEQLKYDGVGGGSAVKLLSNQLEALKAEQHALDLNMSGPVKRGVQAVSRPNGLTEGDVFIAADQAKRLLQKVVSSANDRNPLLFNLLGPKADQLREFLTDESIWTPALAKMQRDTNDAWAKAIASRMDSSLRGIHGKAGLKSEFNAYDLPDKVDDGWLAAHLQQIGSATEEQTVEATNRWLNASADDAMTRAGAYGSDELQKAAKRMSELRHELQADLGRVSQVNVNTAAASAPSLGVLNYVPGSGYVTEAALNRARSWAHKATTETATRIDKAAALPALLGKPKASLAAAALTKVAQQREKLGAALERYVERYASGQTDDDDARYVDMLEKAFGPEMANAERARLTRQQQFLMEKSGDPNSPLFKQQFRKYAEPALHPLEAIDRVAAGEATPEDRETLKALHPQLLANFMRRALEAVSKADTTYDQRLRISQALGVPLDASLEPARYQMHQEIAAQQAGQAAQARQQQQNQVLTPGNRKKPEVDEMVAPAP